MPYYVHHADMEPNGPKYDTAKDAHEAKKRIEALATDHDDCAICGTGSGCGKLYTVTFRADDSEKLEWRYRERMRFMSGYAPVPWAESEWYYLCPRDESATTLRSDCSRDEDDLSFDRLHYAHLSVTHPGLIAYTPSEEWGVQDRQLRVRPGKYLAQFAPTLSKNEIDVYCAACKSFDESNELFFVTSAKDIVAIYTNGPNSCMSRETRSYDSDVHPTSAYGDSDLSLCYMKDGERIIARTLVWESQKTYSRIYGDIARMTTLLRSAGYTQSFPIGATIKAIVHRDGEQYVMPYVDGIEKATRKRNVFVLDNEGAYPTDCTDGLTRQRDVYTCMNCGDEVDENDSYCSHCEEDRYECAHCGREQSGVDSAECIDGIGAVCTRCYNNHEQCSECADHFWDSDDVTDVRGIDYVCTSCLENMTSTCEIDGCDETWIEGSLSDIDQKLRTRDHVSELCPSCASKFRYCADCDDYTPADEDGCEVCARPQRCDRTLDLLANIPADVWILEYWETDYPFYHREFSSVADMIADLGSCYCAHVRIRFNNSALEAF